MSARFLHLSSRLDHPDAILLRPPRQLRRGCGTVEAVVRAGVNMQLDRHACRGEFLGVADVLVPEDVELADLDVARRQSVA